MKNITNKLTVLIITLTLLFAGAGQMWGVNASLYSGDRLYIDCTNWLAANAHIKLSVYGTNGSWSKDVWPSHLKDNIYYWDVDGTFNGFQITRVDPNDHGKSWNYTYTIWADQRSGNDVYMIVLGPCKTTESGYPYWANGPYNVTDQTFYFNNSVTGWDIPYLRIGRTNYCVGHNMALVAGTRNLFSKYDGFIGYEALCVADKASYTGQGNSIYGKGDGDYLVTASTTHYKESVSTALYINATAFDEEGDDGVNYYTTSFSTGTPSHTISVSATNCSVSLEKYTSDPDDDTPTTTSLANDGTGSVLPTQYIKVSTTPNTGYDFSSVSVSNSGTKTAATSSVDGIYWINDDAIVTAICTAQTYSITYKDCGGGDFSGSHADGYPTTHTYGTATTLKSASKDGSTFLGWYTDKACTGTRVTSLAADGYTDDITLYAKWTTTLYDSYFYQTYAAAGKTASVLITDAGFPFYINTDITQNGTGHPSLASEISTPYDFTNISLVSNSSYLKAGGNITLTAVADVKAVHFYGYQREGYTYKRISTTVTHESGEGSSFSVADVVTSGSESATQQIGDFVVYLSTTDGSSARANYDKTGYYTYNFNLGGNFWLWGIYVEKETYVASSGVTVNNTDTTLIIGETITAAATITPDNTTVKTATWLSSDTDVATVSAAGVVTAVAAGSATITATVDDVSASFVVTVESCESYVGTIYRMSPTTAHTIGSDIAVGQKDNYSAYADIYRGGRVWIGNGKAEGTVPKTDWCFYSQNGGVQLQMWSDGGYAILNLNCALRNGDTIQYVEGYNTSGQLFNSNIAFTTSATRSTTYCTDSDHKYIVTEGDGLNGADSIYIWQGTDRSAIRSIEVRRPLSVVYDGNGAESGSEPSAAAYAAGATATVAGNTGGLAKDGYMFYGWNTKADGMGTFYRVGDTFTMPSRTTTLYAMWATATEETFYYGQVRIEDGALNTGGGKTLQFFTESSGTFATSTALSMTPEPNRSSSRTYDSNDMSGLTTEGNWSASGGATPYILTERFYRTIDKGVSVSPYKLALGNRFATSITFYGHFNRNEDQTITIGGVERHTPTTADTFFYREFTKSGDFTDTVNIDLSYGELYGMLKIITQKPTDVPVVTFAGNSLTTVTNLPAERYVSSGSKILAPTETPVRENCTFLGWYKESACINAWNWSTDVVSGNTTLYAKWSNFVIYRTGDKDDDSHATEDDVETYAGGEIDRTIEFRMKVRELDHWYSLCLPFTVSAVKVWDEEDGAYYDLVPYYRAGDKFYTGHYVIRTPELTNDSIATANFGNWNDPESPIDYLPSKNTPYIVQWHHPYFEGRYVSFFGAAGQEIPTEMTVGVAPKSKSWLAVYGNDAMVDGTVVDAYTLNGDETWERPVDKGESVTIHPFECYIRANSVITDKFLMLRRGMSFDDSPTDFESINVSSPVTSKVLIDGQLYIIREGKMYTIQGTLAQ